MIDTTTTPIDTSPVDANLSLVERFYNEIINGDNAAALEEVVSNDFVDHIPNPLPGQPTRGAEAITWFVRTARKAIPDLKVSIEDVIAAGDKVVTRVTWEGTQEGPLLGADPTGKRMRFMGIDIVRVADGKIMEHWGQIDALGAMAQLGFLNFFSL